MWEEMTEDREEAQDLHIDTHECTESGMNYICHSGRLTEG